MKLGSSSIARTAAMAVALILSNAGCMTAYKQSQGGDTQRVFERVFVTDFNTSWQGVLDSVKSLRLDVSNREGGYLQTRWTDNTLQAAFLESFGEAASFLKAQYRFKINVAKGFYGGRQSVKVSVLKEQLIQRDVLEGWKPVETDTVEEKTLLYRIGRVIAIRTRIAQIEDAKTRQAIEGN